MNDSHSRSTPVHPSQRELLGRYGLRPKHHFGQNFLTEPAILNRLSTLITTDAGGVIEIGAGLGALTRPLIHSAAKVIAIERDRDLIPPLSAEFADALASGQLTLLEADAKTANYAELLQSLPAPRVLCGNLPYQLTGPLLRLTPLLAPQIARAVFLVQLEVADRMAAAPDSKEYGALSVFTQAAFAVRRAFIVRSGAFLPNPRVDSAVVVLTPHPSAIAHETEAFVQLVHCAFQKRRKTLRNAWSGALGLSQEQLSDHAQHVGIDLGVRGETLSVEDFARMAREISK